MREESKFLSHPVAGAAAVFVVAAIVTLVMAAPVLRDPASRLFGTETVGRHEAPFTAIHYFEHPRPLGLYVQPATDWAGTALTRLTGSGVVAFNLLVLASFPLAALFAYLLAFHLTGSALASRIAALFYAFAPFHLAHAAYHPHGAQTQWLPLYLLVLFRCLDSATARRIVGLVASAALVVLSNFYYGLIAVVLTPLAVGGYWYFVTRHRPGAARALGVTVAALAAQAVAGGTYLLVVAPAVLARPDSLAFSPRSELSLYCARWWSYLVPPLEHPFAGDWARALWSEHGLTGPLEQQVTIGVGLLLLAAVALVSAPGSRRRELRAVPVLALLGAVAFLCSLSPDLPLGKVLLVRPSGLLYDVLPIFRAYARFGLAVLLAVAILAGLGAVTLLRSRSKGAILLVAGLLVLAVVELTPLPPWHWRHVLPTAAHRWLSASETATTVLDCASGLVPANLSIVSLFKNEIRLLGPFEECGDPGLAGRLAAEGRTHVIVRRDTEFYRWLERRLESGAAWPGLTSVREFADSRVFGLEPAPVPEPLVMQVAGGFHWREYKGLETYRWMGQRGSMRVVNTTGSEVRGVLEVTAHSFPGPRAVRVIWDDQELGELQVPTGPASYDLGPLTIRPGDHTLILEALEPAVVADDILGNGDRREITIALDGWSWTAK